MKMKTNTQTHNSTYHLHSKEKASLTELKEAHIFFLEKIIPEIELHFLLVTEQCSTIDKKLVASYALKFKQFSNTLHDHILMEEKYIFPYLEGKSMPSEKEVILNFLEHHDDFEKQLQYFVEELVARLSKLKDLMAYRMLALKLNRLNEKLIEHSLLEESLF
jgi:iron-sulfur cluster repair protein YtfE (RIC family)